MNLARASRALIVCVFAAAADASAQPAPSPSDPAYLRVRILSSFRDQRGSLTILLDVGSARGVTSGMRGHVLEGDSERLLPNSEFVVTRVSSATQSIARVVTARTLGARNTRGVLHLRR